MLILCVIAVCALALFLNYRFPPPEGPAPAAALPDDDEWEMDYVEIWGDDLPW